MATIVAIALAAGGTAKGLTGLGLPMVAVPVLAGFLGVERAVMIMIMPVLVLNIWLSWTLRDCAKEVPEMRRLLLAMAPLFDWTCRLSAAVGKTERSTARLPLASDVT